MQTPTNLKNFVKTNKGKTYYCAHMWQGHGRVVEVTPYSVDYLSSKSIIWTSPDREYNGRLCGFDSIYERRKDAALEVKFYELACSQFQHTPLVRPSYLMDNLVALLSIELLIAQALADHPDFDGVEFYQDHRGKIGVRTFHKQVRGCCFGDYKFLEPDLSNRDEVIDFAISNFKRLDNPGTISYAKSFISDGERYGFD